VRLIIAISDLIEWRIRHAVTRRRPPVPCSLFPVPSILSGPTEGPGCVTDDAGEHGRSLSGMMPASPSGAVAELQPSTCRAPRAVEKRRAFITGPLGDRPPVGRSSAAGPWPLVITGQGDFVQEYFG